jgi:hypothetical protein
MDTALPEPKGSNGSAFIALNGISEKPKTERIQVINDEKEFTFV